MRLLSTIDLVIFLVENAPSLWKNQNYDIPEAALKDYWVAARLQLDDWTREFLALANPSSRTEKWPYRNQRAGLAEEILVQQMLSRIWLAVLTAREYQGFGPESLAGALANSVYDAHEELRNRVMKALAEPDFLPPADVQKLLRLCERTDRWSDQLLAWLSEWGSLAALAADPYRMNDFTADWDRIRSPKRRQQTWNLLKASLRSSYESRMFRYAPHSSWWGLLPVHIVRCFPAGVSEACRGESFYQVSQLLWKFLQTEELLLRALEEQPPPQLPVPQPES